MITEKIIYIYRQSGNPQRISLSVPQDITVEDLTKIVLSNGILLWFIGGEYYLVPAPMLENIVSVFEDSEKITGGTVVPLQLMLELRDMQKIGPI